MTDNSLFPNHWNNADREDALRLSGPIAIFGASGFIGANLFFRLSSLRDDVYGVSRDVGSSWRLANSPNSFHRCFSVDITYPNKVDDVVSQLQPRTVFNMAAYGGFERQSDALRIHDVNYLGTLHLIRTLLEHGCDAFVQAGSSSEYRLELLGPR